MIRKFPAKFFCTALLFAASLLCGCKEKEETPIDYGAIMYKSFLPSKVSIDSTSAFNIRALTKRYEYDFPIMVGDTLNVSVLEFKSDVYALDYYMNSGRFQGSTPILRGEFLEQSIRADQRIFIFKHDSFRHYERRDLENFVKKFPGYRGGFPQEFLSLPFDYREQGKTSIQTKFFLGRESKFPVLEQSYRNGGLRWNVARSWDLVEVGAFDEWAKGLEKATPKGIATSSDVVYFHAGEGINGMATILAGGRVAVVWGYLDWFDLEKIFFTASDRIFEARF